MYSATFNCGSFQRVDVLGAAESPDAHWLALKDSAEQGGEKLIVLANIFYC